MSINISELSGRKGLTENLFEKIGDLAQQTGTPSKEELEKLSKEFLVGKANVYGSATFYDFTREENKGKKVYVCQGSACLCAGTQENVTQKLKTHFDENEIGTMYCLGRCHENSAFFYENKNYSGNDIDSFSKEKNTKTIEATDDYQIKSSGVSVLCNNDIQFEDFKSSLENLFSKNKTDILTEIKTSGLRGRGGAGFPMSFKLEAVQKETSDVKYIVCNADEGDPGAYSDRYLLEKQLAKVLLGMMMAGFVTGANWGVLYIRAEYPESIAWVEKKLVDLYAENLLGKNILNSGFDFDFKLIKAQGAYICGEETALLSSIEGQRPEVRVRPPYPAQKGLFNKPTVVNNVETLACLPYILKNGGEAFSKLGDGKSTGTKLISLDSFFNHPGIYEVEMGTTLKFVIEELGGGFKEDIKAMHIGGPLGGLVPVSKINDLKISFESFQSNGFLLGHASVVCIPQHFPLINYLAHLFQFTAHESCGKCFPCRIGSTRGYEMIENAISNNEKMDRTLLNDLLETLEIGSLCALGGGLPLPIKNALHYFEDELAGYFE
ncbi:MAG: NAD(P)H-dependent oxidoreductase subunit E [Chitinophagaceae bacterium]|nr:NAD(P)H-dependent oxidoreductase subunit E [Chitinophagaceae bacterium]